MPQKDLRVLKPSSLQPRPRALPATAAAERQVAAHPAPPFSELLRLEATIENSYAYNSRLYDACESTASLETVTRFLYWDYVQPPFNLFLRKWTSKASGITAIALEAHIRIEEEEEHARLFTEAMDYLAQRVPAPADIDYQRLEVLNYTFSDQCAEEQGIGFFIGSFFATEMMSAKRNSQMLAGLTRLGIPEDKLIYFRLHSKVDAAHGREVWDQFIVQSIQDGATTMEQVEAGLLDRITRSGDYLRWYESRYL